MIDGSGSRTQCRVIALAQNFLSTTEAATLRRRANDAGWHAVDRVNRGRYDENTDLIAAELLARLCSAARPLVPRAEQLIATWYRLRAGCFCHTPVKGRDGGVAGPFELVLDFSLRMTGEAEIAYVDDLGRGLLLPQLPLSLVLLDRGTATWRKQRYLRHWVGTAQVCRLFAEIG